MDVSRREMLLSAAALSAGADASMAKALVQASASASGAPWDLTDLYPSAAAWEAHRKALAASLPELSRFQGTLGKSPAALRTALQAVSDATRQVNRLIAYAYLKAHEDMRISSNVERIQQSEDLFSALNQARSWTNPEILGLGAQRIRGFISAEPGLAKFRFQLEDVLRMAPHTLSAEGENLLAAAIAPLTSPSQIRQQLATVDLPRPTVTLSSGEKVYLDGPAYRKHSRSPNRTDRKIAYDGLQQAYKAFEASLGETLAAKVTGDQFRAKARHYKSALEMVLADDNIPIGVYKTLITEANRGAPVLHRYLQLRRRMLKLSDIGLWDMTVPLTQSDRKFTLASMRTIALEAMQPLGPEYIRMLSVGTAAKWMDALPREGKVSGGYTQGGPRDVHPYVLLNLTEDYSGLTSYMHEWGHVVHSMLAKSAQPYETSGSSVFTAEVASTGAEQLLVAHLLKNAKTREEKLFYLTKQMDQFYGTFFRQTMYAEFELAIHELAEAGEGLSGEKFSRVYGELLRKYYGPQTKLEPIHSIDWATISHFYGDFYVFQYATAISGAVYLAQSVLNGRAAERDRYISILKAGESDYPTDILKRAGLDMTTPAPYRALVEEFSNVLDQAEALI